WKMEGNDYKTANRTAPADPSPNNVCNPSCFNISFQAKTLNGWYGYYAVNNGVNSISGKTGGACGSVTQAGGPDGNTSNTYQVTLMTTPGNDPIAGAFIPFTPPGGGLSVRIGDDRVINY